MQIGLRFLGWRSSFRRYCIRNCSYENRKTVSYLHQPQPQPQQQSRRSVVHNNNRCWRRQSVCWLGSLTTSLVLTRLLVVVEPFLRPTNFTPPASLSSSSNRPRSDRVGSTATPRSAVWGMASMSFSAGADNLAAVSTADGPHANDNDNGNANGNGNPLQAMFSRMDPSWVNELSPEEGDDDPDRNRSMRPVRNGHYVRVLPTPLRSPQLVAYSPELATALLGPSGDVDAAVRSPEFARYFSGDVDVATGGSPPTWATPYALSIMGTRYTSNCPYGNGDGYGDGRAISVAEVVVNSNSNDNDNDTTQRWELQLKGAGPTPFCRGADGRAVLRSSIREFLASEAMHALGVSTTRALSLVVSAGDGADFSRRPWYDGRVADDATASPQITVDDPRLASYSPERRREIVEQVIRQHKLRPTKQNPDIMIKERNAITCRAAQSFVRVGHIDLYYRRLFKTLNEDKTRFDTSSREWKELEQMVRHAVRRELPTLEADDLSKMTDALLRHSARGISQLMAGWIRVGFCQGNFNGDNCLVAGRTMDYGPFGFMDQYDPLFAKWTGSGEHFAFLQQPNAGLVNYRVLVESVLPLLVEDSGANVNTDEAKAILDSYMKEATQIFQKDLDDMWSRKLGFNPAVTDYNVEDLWAEMEGLMRETSADWTMTFRQLYYVLKAHPLQNDKDKEPDYEAMVDLFKANDYDDGGSGPFYEPLTVETRQQWMAWLRQWREALTKEQAKVDPKTFDAEETLRLANPKYVLREWMLVDAYTRAAEGDYQELHSLQRLTEYPYDEGTEAQHAAYYRRAKNTALRAGGTAYMS